MSLPVILHPEIHQELESARKWYDQMSYSLADEFLRCFVVTLDQIYRNPEMYAVVEAGLRKANLRRFPYQVFYGIGVDQVFILGLIHSHAEPKATISRLTSRNPQH